MRVGVLGRPTDQGVAAMAQRVDGQLDRRERGLAGLAGLLGHGVMAPGLEAERDDFGPTGSVDRLERRLQVLGLVRDVV